MWLEISNITVIVITTLNFCKLVILLFLRLVDMVRIELTLTIMSLIDSTLFIVERIVNAHLLVIILTLHFLVQLEYY